MEVDTKAHRILIVEDEALIAMHLESSLMGLGHNVEAIATRMDKAVLLARTIDIDFAILDINVAGIQSFRLPIFCVGVAFLLCSPRGTGPQAL